MYRTKYNNMYKNDAKIFKIIETSRFKRLVADWEEPNICWKEENNVINH